MSDVTNFSILATKILTWIEGNTSIRYVLPDQLEVAHVSDDVRQFVVKSEWADVSQSHQAMAMIASRMRLVITGTAKRSSDAEPWEVYTPTNITSINCAFQFELHGGGQQSVVRAFTFKNGELYHVR